MRITGIVRSAAPAKTCIRCTKLTELENEYLRMEAEDKEIQNRIAREREEGR